MKIFKDWTAGLTLKEMTGLMSAIRGADELCFRNTKELVRVIRGLILFNADSKTGFMNENGMDDLEVVKVLHSSIVTIQRSKGSISSHWIDHMLLAISVIAKHHPDGKKWRGILDALVTFNLIHKKSNRLVNVSYSGNKDVKKNADVTEVTEENNSKNKQPIPLGPTFSLNNYLEIGPDSKVILSNKEQSVVNKLDTLVKRGKENELSNSKDLLGTHVHGNMTNNKLVKPYLNENEAWNKAVERLKPVWLYNMEKTVIEKIITALDENTDIKDCLDVDIPFLVGVKNILRRLCLGDYQARELEDMYNKFTKIASNRHCAKGTIFDLIFTISKISDFHPDSKISDIFLIGTKTGKHSLEFISDNAWIKNYSSNMIYDTFSFIDKMKVESFDYAIFTANVCELINVHSFTEVRTDVIDYINDIIYTMTEDSDYGKNLFYVLKFLLLEHPCAFIKKAIIDNLLTYESYAMSTNVTSIIQRFMDEIFIDVESEEYLEVGKLIDERLRKYKEDELAKACIQSYTPPRIMPWPVPHLQQEIPESLKDSISKVNTGTCSDKALLEDMAKCSDLKTTTRDGETKPTDTFSSSTSDRLLTDLSRKQETTNEFTADRMANMIKNRELYKDDNRNFMSLNSPLTYETLFSTHTDIDNAINQIQEYLQDTFTDFTFSDKSTNFPETPKEIKSLLDELNDYASKLNNAKSKMIKKPKLREWVKNISCQNNLDVVKAFRPATCSLDDESTFIFIDIQRIAYNILYAKEDNVFNRSEGNKMLGMRSDITLNKTLYTLMYKLYQNPYENEKEITQMTDAQIIFKEYAEYLKSINSDEADYWQKIIHNL